jgi:hypothetical protein
MSIGSLNQLRLPPDKSLLSVLELSVKVKNKIKVHLMMMTMMIGKYQLPPQQTFSSTEKGSVT